MRYAYGAITKLIEGSRVQYRYIQYKELVSSSASRAMALNGRTDVDIHGEEEEKQYKQIYKVLIIGDSNVGKTALLTRFVEGRFQSAFMSTVGEYELFPFGRLQL